MPRIGIRIRLALALAAGAALTLLAAPGALADSVTSSNWAGYAAHRGGLRFKRVTGTWRQPAATCTPGQATYSSAWVGLGGFSETSQALEQIGSEMDCTARGRSVSSVWYELVPAGSRTIRMQVRSGDTLRATVAVDAGKVTLSIRDLTRRRSFSKTLRAPQVDVSSAEWILETPSVCSSGSCRVLPLANFGQAAFTGARATPGGGRAGSISSRLWKSTRITLATVGRHFIDRGPSSRLPTAVPSPLSSAGARFSVTYRAPQTTATPAAAATSVRQAGVRAGRTLVRTTGRMARPAAQAPARGGVLMRPRREP